MSATGTLPGIVEDPEPGPDTEADRRRDWTVVLLPWLLSRLISVGSLWVTAHHQFHRWSSDAFYLWDGVWYLRIATWGYGGPLLDKEVQTPWPFFPLLPGVGRLIHEAGVPLWIGMALLTNVSFVLALVGVHRLARQVGMDRPQARLAVWVIAFFPASVVFSMIYPSSLFLAGMVWAFVFVGERRYRWAGLAAVVVVLARPNGFLFLAPLALAVAWPLRRADWRDDVRNLVAACGPPGLALLGWLALMQRWSGDAFVFYEAKAGWDEVQLNEYFANPDKAITVHVLVGVVGLGVLLLAAWKLPLSWTVLALLLILPSLALGLIGLGRYTNEAFPVSMAIAVLAGRHANRLLPLVVVVGGVGMVVWSNAIARLIIVP